MDKVGKIHLLVTALIAASCGYAVFLLHKELKLLRSDISKIKMSLTDEEKLQKALEQISLRNNLVPEEVSDWVNTNSVIFNGSGTEKITDHCDQDKIQQDLEKYLYEHDKDSEEISSVVEHFGTSGMYQTHNDNTITDGNISDENWVTVQSIFNEFMINEPMISKIRTESLHPPFINGPKCGSTPKISAICPDNNDIPEINLLSGNRDGSVQHEITSNTTIKDEDREDREDRESRTISENHEDSDEDHEDLELLSGLGGFMSSSNLNHAELQEPTIEPFPITSQILEQVKHKDENIVKSPWCGALIKRGKRQGLHCGKINCTVHKQS